MKSLLTDFVVGSLHAGQRPSRLYSQRIVPDSRNPQWGRTGRPRSAQTSGLLASLLLIAAAPVAQANLLLNGSFEAPVQLADGIYFGITPTDWSGGAVLFRGEPSPGSWPSPQHGEQFEDIGFTGYSLSQSFDLTDAGAYTLTWYDNAALGVGHSYSVEMDGDSKGTFADVGSSAWKPRSISLTLSAGSHTLVFAGGAGFDTLLDNVSLDAAGVGSVPDSGGSFMLLGSAIASLSLFRRRQSAR